MRNYDDGAIILVGDDEAAMRHVLHAQLSARGHSVYEAGTGADVLRTVSELEPDVILLDLGLPDIDGIEVTQRLRRSTQTPIIILSARTSHGYDQDGCWVRAGCLPLPKGLVGRP